MICPNPGECCRELSRVWEALGVTTYLPGRGSCSEQVGRLRAEVLRLRALDAIRTESISAALAAGLLELIADWQAALDNGDGDLITYLEPLIIARSIETARAARRIA